MSFGQRKQILKSRNPRLVLPNLLGEYVFTPAINGYGFAVSFISMWICSYGKCFNTILLIEKHMLSLHTLKSRYICVYECTITNCMHAFHLNNTHGKAQAKFWYLWILDSMFAFLQCKPASNDQSLFGLIENLSVDSLLQRKEKWNNFLICSYDLQIIWASTGWLGYSLEIDLTLRTT